MKWTKINQRTGEVFKRGCNSFEPHDYIAGNFRIINNEWLVRKQGWILQANGREIGRFDTLKQAKTRAEELESLAEWI